MISKRILIFLVITFIISLGYGYLQMPKQERITTKVKITSTKGKESPKGTATIPRLRIDLLNSKPQPFSGVRRDLFFSSFHAPTYQVEEAVVQEEPPEVIAPPVVVAPPPPPPPTPQEIARQELSRYKFLGFFKKGDMQTIFLSANDEISLIRKGNYLGRDRKYFVVNITDSTLVLRKEGAGDFSVKLADQESLTAVPIKSASVTSPRTDSARTNVQLIDSTELDPEPDIQPQEVEESQSQEDQK